VPHPQLTPCISRATDPGLNPVQRAAADAAVASASVRVCGGRVLLLLEARQALSVCLRCWQLQGWWPDPVGALMGAFPRASAAADEFAREDAAACKAVSFCLSLLCMHKFGAPQCTQQTTPQCQFLLLTQLTGQRLLFVYVFLRFQGDPSAPPPAPPRQGPRQLLSSLLGLADLCPEEWPHRGASKAAAKQRDAAAAEGQPSPEGAHYFGQTSDHAQDRPGTYNHAPPSQPGRYAAFSAFLTGVHRDPVGTQVG
jgi:hypothetical protein